MDFEIDCGDRVLINAEDSHLNGQSLTVHSRPFIEKTLEYGWILWDLSVEVEEGGELVQYGFDLEEVTPV